MTPQPTAVCVHELGADRSVIVAGGPSRDVAIRAALALGLALEGTVFSLAAGIDVLQPDEVIGTPIHEYELVGVGGAV